MSETEKNKLTSEQLQRLIALQQKMEQNPKKSSQVVEKFIVNTIQRMQSLIVYLDRFINFVTKKTDSNRNDVLQAARSPILFGVYIIILFVVFGGIWSGVAPLDSAAVAVGTVISHSNKKSIQHQEGGIIKNIFVHQGDRVVVGEKLIELEDARIRSQYENLLNQYRTALAAESRLIAERDNLEKIEFQEFLLKDLHSPVMDKIIHTQENLFRSKREVYRIEKESLRQEIAQLNKQVEGLQAKKISLKKSLEVVVDRLNATKALYKKNLVQRAALLELEAKEANIISEIAMTKTEIARTYQKITKVEIEIINLHNKYFNQTISELKETQVQVTSFREQFLATSDALEKTVIRSPMDGIVNSLQVHTIGGVIGGGQQIIEISPLNDSLIIEAKVPQRNIDSVHVGLVAKIRFSAFKSRTTPLFTGKVISLSPDVVQDRNQQPGMENVYIARVEMDIEEFNKIAKPRNLELHPGMQAEVQIVTGTRTLLKYLLAPVTDVMFRAFREK